MARIAPPDDYEEDAERIDEEYIPDDATTDREVQQALQDAGFPESAQSDISDWLVNEDDAWDLVGEGGSTKVVDSGSVERAIQSESNGAVSDRRAQSIAEEVGETIDSARSEAASSVTVASDGTMRRDDGAPIGTFSNVEEQVRDDGIYFRNTNSGQEYKAAGFDR
jgi:hypothetical protein